MLTHEYRSRSNGYRRHPRMRCVVNEPDGDMIRIRKCREVPERGTRDRNTACARHGVLSVRQREYRALLIPPNPIDRPTNFLMSRHRHAKEKWQIARNDRIDDVRIGEIRRVDIERIAAHLPQ